MPACFANTKYPFLVFLSNDNSESNFKKRHNNRGNKCIFLFTLNFIFLKLLILKRDESRDDLMYSTGFREYFGMRV